MKSKYYIKRKMIQNKFGQVFIRETDFCRTGTNTLIYTKSTECCLNNTMKGDITETIF